jgi:hypothetical protein
MDKYDFYDYDKVVNLQETRAGKYLELVRKLRVAREAADERAIERIRKAIRKYRDQNEKYKDMAEDSRAYWYLR